MNIIVNTQRVYDVAKCGAKTINYLQHRNSELFATRKQELAATHK